MEGVGYYEDIWPNGGVKSAWHWVLNIIDFYKQNLYEKHHGPGGWFHPNALIIGLNLMTEEQEKTHFAIWAVMAAPLYMSNVTDGDVEVLDETVLLAESLFIQRDTDFIVFYDTSW